MRVNANLAAAGFNFKGLLNKIKEAILWYHILFNRNLNRLNLIVGVSSS